MLRKLTVPRIVPVLAVLGVAISLAACSRENKIVNPLVTGPVTWNNTVRHLIADRSEGTAPTGCTSCHHDGTTIADWTLYANVYDDRDSIKSVLGPGGRMRRFLQAGEPEIIISWINAGAPEQ